MRYALILLAVAACTYELPKPGTPEAARACENLRLTVEKVKHDFPEQEDDYARGSFLLQAREYAERLGCPFVVSLE